MNEMNEINDDKIKNEVYTMVENLVAYFDLSILAKNLDISQAMLYSLKNRKYNHTVSATTYLKIKGFYDDYCKK